jgi:hypothetical protein
MTDQPNGQVNPPESIFGVLGLFGTLYVVCAREKASTLAKCWPGSIDDEA